MKFAHVFALAALGAAFPALAADLSVGQQNQTFSMPSMNVHVGDKVTFNNQDDITIKGGADGDAEDLGLEKPGKSVNYTFDAKGAYRVICSIHPKMKMTINVQ